MKKAKFLTILLTLFMILSLQSQTEKCFNRTQLDSIYSKLLQLEYVHQENEAINYVLTSKDARIDNLTSQIVTLKDIANDYEKIIQTDKQVISNFENLYKAERNKKWGWLFRGVIIGGGATFVLVNL